MHRHRSPAVLMLLPMAISPSVWPFMAITGPLLSRARRPISLAMAMVPWGTSSAILAVLFFFFGFFRTTGLLMYSQIKELVPLSMAGMAMTGVNFFTMVGSAAFLQGLGNLMQSLYPQASRGPDAFRVAFLLCSAFLLSVVVVYAATKDTKAQER